MQVLLLVVVGMVVMLQLPHQGNADCCIGLALGLFGHRMCEDCEYGTPYCGVGSCNIFGCHCDGGCRSPPCDHHHSNSKFYGSIPATQATAGDVIVEADKDLDGRMSEEEAHAVLAHMPFPAERVGKEFKKMDVDQDGFLAPEEIDGYPW